MAERSLNEVCSATADQEDSVSDHSSKSTGSVIDLNSIIQNITDDEGKSFEESLQGIPEEERNISILVLGNPGSGKSTLVNSLLHATGTDTPKVKHGIAAQQHDDIEVFAGTPNCYSETYKSNLTFCDTNGLPPRHQQVGFFEKSMGTKISKKLKDKDIAPDLIFICIPLTERHREFPDVNKIASKLGYEVFWHRTVIMLTFANTLYERAEKDLKEWTDTITEAVRIIRMSLQSLIKDETIQRIPFVCVGKADPIEPKPDDSINKNENDWIGALLEVCFDRCSKEKEISFLNIAQAYWQRKRYKLQKKRAGERSSTITFCYAAK